MTFKHVKFEDSPIMRSLEKVAREKGLVKDEPIAKTASAPAIDLAPSSNLMSNVLKLCAGLRASGFDKYASELELAYLNYKRANTLYETSKEKGEDLVDEAHPKGSHKLEGIDGDDAVVETILDNHLKMVEMINKKPTGKLAASQDVMKAVKKVLAQPAQEYRDATPEEIQKLSPEQISSYVKRNIIDLAHQAHGQATTGMSQAHTKARNQELDMDVVSKIGTQLQIANNAWSEMRNAKEPSVEGLQKMIGTYKGAKMIVDNNIDDQSLAGIVNGYFDSAIGEISKLVNAMKAFNNDPSKIPYGVPHPKMVKAPVGADLTQRIKSLKEKLEDYGKLIPLRVKKPYQEQARGYLSNWVAEIGVIEPRVNDATRKTEFETKLANLEKWVGDFGKQWLHE